LYLFYLKSHTNLVVFERKSAILTRNIKIADLRQCCATGASVVQHEMH